HRVIYLLCLTELAGVIALFFALSRGGFLAFGRLQQVLKVIVTLPLVISGSVHLVFPSALAEMIPPVFPARTVLVVLSGLLELAGAAGLWLPRTERSASLSIALLMIAVFPANIYAAGQTVHGLRMPPLAPRLLMQVIYIALVLMAGWGRPRLRFQ
ncbi:MAG: hypothetical protein QOH85_1602, partial [Acidobacteriaceae bacterium]|nr:hypothetical protein [Acidobacteriaceae bacterium]